MGKNLLWIGEQAQMEKALEKFDEFERRSLDNVVSRLIEKTEARRYEEPNLVIKGGYVDDFEYFGTDPIHHRRFVIVNVINEGSRSATDCCAQITIPSLGLDKIPLHWADESYEMRRNSMDRITIPPRVPRDLDVAFSVYGQEYDEGKTPRTSGRPAIITGGSTSTSNKTKTSTETKITSHGVARGTYDPTLLRGTYDPRPTPTGARLFEEISKTFDPKLKGSWLASHLVLANPKEKSEHYLPPNSPQIRYDCEIEVICGNGRGESRSIILISSINPSELEFQW